MQPRPGDTIARPSARLDRRYRTACAMTARTTPTRSPAQLVRSTTLYVLQRRPVAPATFWS